MRVILHIGTEKTGTTTIQEFLHRNKAGLGEQGILVPISADAPKSSNHRKLAVYGCNDSNKDDGRVSLGIVSMPKFRATFERDFLEECSKSGCDTLILSGEHCSSRLQSEEEVRRLKSLLDKVGQTTILLYLRRQEEMWRSWYSTAVSLGSHENFSAPSPLLRGKLLDYQALCRRWAKVFGASAIRVRVFSESEFVDQDLLHDFEFASGLKFNWQTVFIPPARNTSIRMKLLKFLRRFNVYLPHMSAETNFHPDPRQGDLLRILRKLSQDMPPDVISPNQPEWAKSFNEGNAYVARTFLGREDGILFKEDTSAVTATSPNAPLTMDEAFEIFAKIWAEKNQPKQK